MPDFLSLTGIADLAILPDGGVLVARAGVHRYDAGGALVQTFPVAALAIGLRRFGQSALISEYCQPFAIDLDLGTGATELAYELQAADDAREILPSDGWSAALGATTVDIPALTDGILATLAALLALIAIRRLT